MKISPPDFEKIFFETFQQCPDGIDYRVRQDSNFWHDMQFMRSLIRDAQFRMVDVNLVKHTLEIRLSRGRWELGNEIRNCNLIRIPSVLKFSRVRQVELRHRRVATPQLFSGILYQDSDVPSPEQLCEIDGIHLGESSMGRNGSPLEVIVHGHPGNWELRVQLDEARPGISIKDGPTEGAS